MEATTATTLVFGMKNSKLMQLSKKTNRKVAGFGKLAGHTCLFAKDCLSKVINGKVIDGKHTKFRCFAASNEALYTNVYKSHKLNSNLIKNAIALGKNATVELIVNSIPKSAETIRIFTSGDWQTQTEFDAWMEVAEQQPDILFYAYTKSLPFWVKRLDSIPNNVTLTASRGGKRDDLIAKHNLREAIVVYYATNLEAKSAKYNGPTAESLNLPIDSDDSIAASPTRKNENFCLVIHNVQPKNSDAAIAWQRHKTKVVSYLDAAKERKRILLERIAKNG